MRRLGADVVVVGGGVAGCVAAVRAARTGASVVVLDKVGSIRRSGDAGRGLAFLTAYLDGRTPSPCVDCNTYVKFGALLGRARHLY